MTQAGNTLKLRRPSQFTPNEFRGRHPSNHIKTDCMLVKKMQLVSSPYLEGDVRFFKYNLLRQNLIKMRKAFNCSIDIQTDGFIFRTGKGEYAHRETEKGYFSSRDRNLESIYEAFSRIGLYKYGQFIDLGSGMGDIVFLASIFGIKAYGVEYDLGLHKISLIAKAKFSTIIKDLRNTRFKRADYYGLDFGRFDVLYNSPDPNSLEKDPLTSVLEEKFVKETKPGSLFLIKTPEGFTGKHSKYYSDMSLLLEPLDCSLYMRNDIPFK